MGFAGSLLAASYEYEHESASIPTFLWVVYVVVIALMLAGMWKVFTKAGRPGWECLIPIYSAYVMFIIAGKPGWHILLMLIPIYNIVVLIQVTMGLARKFGKGGGFAAGLIFLGFIFYPILGFGSAQYNAAA